MRVLVIRYRKIGDSLMVTPIIRSLAEAGVESINVIGEKGFERIFTTMPEVDGFEAVSGPEPSRLELARIGLRARKFRCDTALVLRFDRKAAMIARLAGCRTRIGAARKPAKGAMALTKNLLDPAWKDLHQVEKYYAVADAALSGLKRFPTTYCPPDSERSEARRWLGTLPENYAVVHLGNGGSNLDWTDERYCETVAGLQELGVSVIATGAAGGGRSYDSVRQTADLDLIGKTDLDGLAEVMRGAKVVVGLDGGGPRIAAAVGAPVVVVSIGSRWTKHQVAPWMSPGAVVEPLQRCEGCVPFRCTGKGPTCIATLGADRVLTAASEWLGS